MKDNTKLSTGNQGAIKELHWSLTFSQIWEETWPVISLDKCSFPTGITSYWEGDPSEDSKKYRLWQAEKMIADYITKSAHIKPFGWWEVGE